MADGELIGLALEWRDWSEQGNGKCGVEGWVGRGVTVSISGLGVLRVESGMGC